MFVSIDWTFFQFSPCLINQQAFDLCGLSKSTSKYRSVENPISSFHFIHFCWIYFVCVWERFIILEKVQNIYFVCMYVLQYGHYANCILNKHIYIYINFITMQNGFCLMHCMQSGCTFFFSRYFVIVSILLCLMITRKKNA